MARSNSAQLAPPGRDGRTPSQAIAAVPVSRRYAVTKRVIDIAASLSIVTLGAPIWLLVGLAIKLDSRGPILFKQRRVGRNGEEFVMYKFRSMLADADPKVHQEAFRLYAAGVHLEEDGQGGRFKAARDPRVTRVGHFLRATNLDEFPQVFNVIKGEMSLVGPRPAISYELEWYLDWYYGRFQATPGITGLWQIKDRFHIGMEDMMRYDVEYVRKRSTALDMKIIAATGLGPVLSLLRRFKNRGQRGSQES
ncbi:MAG: sugar transferase [Chloroflexota bacterium]